MTFRHRLRRLAAIGVLGALAIAVSGCGSVQHSAQFEPTFVPKADTRIEAGPVTNDTGQTFDVDLPQMFTDALTQELQGQTCCGLLARRAIT